MLIWKDFRLLRPFLIACVALLIYCYVVQPCIFVVGDHYASTAQAIRRGADFVWLPTVLLSAALGGVAFASERRDRSVDLLAMLPVSRARWVFTRLIDSLAIGLLMLLINTIVIESTLAVFPDYIFQGISLDRMALFQDLRGSASACILLFGAAWLGSILLRSPILATACGALAAWLFMCMHELSENRIVFSEYGYGVEWISTVLGLALIVAGTFVQLLRQTP